MSAANIVMSETASPTTVPRAGRGRAWGALAGSMLPTLLALSCVAAVVGMGIYTGWRMPKFSALIGAAAAEPDDWCEEHSVAESICVECRKTKKPASAKASWCRTHGVHECPLCEPSIAQVSSAPEPTAEERERATRALQFAPRVSNNSKCKLHERSIQVTNDEVIDRLGIRVEPVVRAPVSESISAPAEIGYDPTRLARLSSRVRGTVWWVGRNVGDRVRKGDVLALVDASEVGKAKADFQQALVHLELRRQTLASLRSSAATVTGRAIEEAEAAVDEADIQLVNAEQSLANLGLPVRSEDIRGLSPDALASRLRYLGIPEPIARGPASGAGSNNLLAITAPFDGEVVERAAVAGEVADPTKLLFVIADTRNMWLTLRVRLEDADRLREGQVVWFEHEGHVGQDTGTVTWISPAADEKSRAIPVRVNLPNPGGLHAAHTFGTARVVLRNEPKALVVPSAAVHWEGDCNVVFVRDKDFGKPGAAKVFHVRTVRPGAQDMSAKVPITEVIAGLAPGEWVATTNSGIFRTELLKNNLGEG